MENSDFVRAVTIEYWDGTILLINDSWSINMLGGLLSLTSIKDQEELNKILNEEDQNETN